MALYEVGLPLIEIPTGIGLSLIVKSPVGYAYFNQTGGHACRQSWAEGVLVPLPFCPRVPATAQDTQDVLLDVFGPGSRHGGHCSDGIDDADAEQVDALLAMHHHAFQGERVVRVDRARLGDSWEAWVHVIVGPHPARPPKLPSAENALFWPFFGLAAGSAILTWTNSD